MNLQQAYAGGTVYYPDYLDGPHRLLVAFTCGIGDLTQPIYALFDTASEWCVLLPWMAQNMGLDLEPDEATPPLHSRFGLIFGRLERLPLHLFAMEGDSVEIEATCFISRDWPGPMVIGWKGCLERVRFGLDPSEDAFYFARL